jgi:hypothetical protein
MLGDLLVRLERLRQRFVRKLGERRTNELYTPPLKRGFFS